MSGLPRLAALVVDDSAAMRRQLSAALERLAIRAVEAGDGAEAWRRLQEGRFDLVLTDVDMPRLDGLKLLGLIRAGGPHQRTPVLVVTAESGEEDRRRALNLGASAYLRKPVTAQRVIEAVKELLRLD
jgi:two-component system, chemotaxis family, chemotaxis protein CheY